MSVTQHLPERGWRAKWIGYPDVNMVDWRRPVIPAPVFRKSFTLDTPAASPVWRVSGLGYFFLEVDGRRVSDHMLQPAPTQYDRRWRYRVFRTAMLAAGRHTVSVTVGNGLHFTSTHDAWHFDKADWQDYPKMICELTDGEEGAPLLISDSTWSVCSGPIIFNTLRGGETYDARRELPPAGEEPAPVKARSIVEIWPPPDWKKEQVWHFAGVVPPPGGVGEEETIPPCRIVQTYPMRKIAENLWAAPHDIAGVVRLVARGEAGASVELRHGERLSADGTRLDDSAIAHLTFDGTFQKDTYVLKGGGTESWHPEFTYHGFRYVEAASTGKAEILSLEALEIRTDFQRRGSLSTSDRRLMTIAECGTRAALANFVGIPTDCPHREKNGWLSEARLQMETLLYTFDAASAHAAYADLIADAQRPSGQVPGMVPAAGWGYNWGSGTPWDGALVLIPWTLYRFTGDTTPLRCLYPNMLRLLGYFDAVEDADGLVKIGLGDWLPPADAGIVEEGFVQNAFRIRILEIAAAIAHVLAHDADAASLTARRARALETFLKRYDLGGGRFRGTRSTVYALALEFNLVPAADRTAAAAQLNEIIEARDGRVDYGTIGSGCVLRALFEAGYADTAFRVMTQPGCPGYLYWFDTLNLTAFPEYWAPDGGSLNHGAFSDIVACMYRYLAGFRPGAVHPGTKLLEIRPVFPGELADFRADFAGYEVSWRRRDDGIELTVTVPDGCQAHLSALGLDRLLKAGTTTIAR